MPACSCSSAPVRGGGDPDGCHRFVVGPQGDREPVTLVDAQFHPGLERSHRAPGFDEPLRKVDLELRDLLPDVRDPGEDVARQQAQGEVVRVS